MKTTTVRLWLTGSGEDMIHAFWDLWGVGVFPPSPERNRKRADFFDRHDLPPQPELHGVLLFLSHAFFREEHESVGPEEVIDALSHIAPAERLAAYPGYLAGRGWLEDDVGANKMC